MNAFHLQHAVFQVTSQTVSTHLLLTAFNHVSKMEGNKCSAKIPRMVLVGPFRNITFLYNKCYITARNTVQGNITLITYIWIFCYIVFLNTVIWEIFFCFVITKDFFLWLSSLNFHVIKILCSTKTKSDKVVGDG